MQSTSNVRSCVYRQVPALSFSQVPTKTILSTLLSVNKFIKINKKMSFFSDLRRNPGGSTTTVASSDPKVPLNNLALIQTRMDSLQKFLSDSVNSNTILGQPQIDMVSSEIGSAIHQIIVNGAALLSCTPSLSTSYSRPDPAKEQVNNHPKAEIQVDGAAFDDYDLIEMDAVELLTEHVHFCEICGKGFKRDANLRMHMRAHGNRFKTPEALARPDKGGDGAGSTGRRTRFSCPHVGCNRNKQHKKFRPLKSAICVKNHFKRSHCPKMFSCNRCSKKSFSVVADLKSHLKHCGESKWRCSCGTSFSRKDKLFGHMALFEGHMPAVMEEAEEEEEKGKNVDHDDDESNLKDLDMGINGGLEGFFDGCGEMDNCNWFQDGFNSPSNSVGSGMEGFFNFC